MGFVSWLGDPKVNKHLLRDEGEVIVLEVNRHWFAYLRAMVWAVGAVVLLGMGLFVGIDSAWVLMLLGVAAALRACLLALREHRDRFVVTNMRVFRVKGVFMRDLATMPLARILDISVKQPLHGRILGFGHFVFESAAQDQGLREIRFVGDPTARDRKIQAMVQRAGLRGPRMPN
ncbi:PH domain-containing protein [Nocardioides sp. GY 10113]|uniref:PH domain-containing protein n=1 Tax=Nocardioides sp. GY 10113 TaxID=2569761 RepID=UPI0010A843FB|nr:PH domain-containing protein [Nocardioides sp. GY 10113]TIC88158.1 PH domain-containing protein [Nocardioides sp. GY 10113]